jgi:hypothetical protein
VVVTALHLQEACDNQINIILHVYKNMNTKSLAANGLQQTALLPGILRLHMACTVQNDVQSFLLSPRGFWGPSDCDKCLPEHSAHHSSQV